MAESEILQKLKQKTAAVGLRIAIAEGMIPLDDAELVKAFSILVLDTNDEVLQALEENFPHLPRTFLIQTSRQHDISPHLLDFITRQFITDDEILMNITLNKNISDETLIYLAENAPPSILELIANNRNRLLSSPAILETLLGNDRLSKVMSYALQEFKVLFKDSFQKPIHEVPLNTPSRSATMVEDDLPPASQQGDEQTDDEEEVEYSSKADSWETQFKHTIQMSDIPSDDDADTDTDYTDDVADHHEKSSGDDDDEWDISKLTGHVNLDEDDQSEDIDDTDFDLEIEEDLDADDDSDLAEELGFDADEWDGLTQGDDGFDDDDTDEIVEEKILDTRMRLMKMSSAQKLILAATGTKQERMVLVRDANKKVAVAVVEGPKMTDFEIKLITGNRSICEEVLRAIAKHRVWGKHPEIRKELAMNPKTPLDISLRLLNSLNDSDLKEVSKSKEIPYGLAASAKRLFDLREQRRQRH